MPNSAEGHLRIDDFLPHYDFSATYDIRINALPSVVYEQLFWLDFNEVWLVRLLETARTGRLVTYSRLATNLSQRLKGTGFVMLAEVPNEELLMGIVGRFWRPDGGRLLDLTAQDFVGFVRPGYAKVAWNFSLRADSSGQTVLSTETRTQCFGPSATWKFRIYWSLIYPFSGLIRWAILKRVKSKAESNPQPAGH
jgi:hypothetical protein